MYVFYLEHISFVYLLSFLDSRATVVDRYVDMWNMYNTYVFKYIEYVSRSSFSITYILYYVISYLLQRR